MANEYLIKNSTLQGIADAIREKAKTTEEISVADFSSAISNLDTDGVCSQEELDEIDAFIGGDGSSEWFNDGNTHVWVSLTKGCTSPRIGVGINGTVTIDWGDGTTLDILTGNDIEAITYSPIHDYADAGNYIITLITDSEMRIPGDPNGN
jgi:hypothetical protein